MTDETIEGRQIGPLTLAQFRALPFGFHGHMMLDREGHFVCRNNDHGLQAETITPCNKNGAWGKPAHYYYIDGNPNEYTTIEVWYEAFAARYNAVTVEMWREMLEERKPE